MTAPERWEVAAATRRGTRAHNCDGHHAETFGDGTAVGVVIDGTGNTLALAEDVPRLAWAACRSASVDGALAGLVTARHLMADGSQAAAVLAVAPADGPVVVAWIGDCRAWWLDGRTLRQVSTDHTMGEQLRASGGVSAAIAATHDHWLLAGLAQATPATVRTVWVPDHGEEVDPGGLVLLTSDGVHDQLTPERFASLVRMYAEDPQGLADVLVVAARGAPDEDGYVDDATAVVLRRQSAGSR